jgi:hypothetical protein
MVGYLAGAGGGNSSKNSQTDINKYKKLTSTKLSNETLISTVTSLVSSTISQTIVSSNTKIESIIKLTNSINFVGGENCPPMTGNINISNITQQINVTDTVTNTSIMNIVSDITSSVNNKIVTNVQNITKDSNTKTNAQKVASTFEGMVKGVTDGINNCVNDVAKVANGAGDCAGFGNSCSTSNTKETDTELQTKYGLDNNFSLSTVINQNNQTTALVTQNDVTNILASITGSNQIGAVGLCPSFIDISNVSQVITVNNLMSNTTITNIANKVAASYINNLQNIINNMNEHKIEETNSVSSGDIGDLGDAIAGVINSGGNLVSDTIGAVGTASSALVGSTFNAGGKVVNSAIGAVGNILGGLFLPLIIIGVIGAIYWFIIKPQMEKQKNNPPPSENEDEGDDKGESGGDTKEAKYRAYQLGGFHGILQLVSDNIMSQRYV